MSAPKQKPTYTEEDIKAFWQALRRRGKKAALALPKCELWAKVNPLDKFTLAVRLTIVDAFMDDLDFDKDIVIDWMNGKLVFKGLVESITYEIWHKIRNPDQPKLRLKNEP